MPILCSYSRKFTLRGLNRSFGVVSGFALMEVRFVCLPVTKAALLCSYLLCAIYIFRLILHLHHSYRNATFHYRRSSTAYFGGMCSVSHGVGVNEVRFTVTHPALLCGRIAV